MAAFPLVAGVLGRSVQNRRAYLAAMEERALRAEQSRDSEARRRVAEERLRIARELHDLVAHQITLANAQAVVAAHLFDTRPEQTRKSLDELVETTAWRRPHEPGGAFQVRFRPPSRTMTSPVR